jgi:predicted nuclease of predicted toxin-antitoxin system
MKLLLDECIPRKFKFDLLSHGYEVVTVLEAGFSGKTNGELLNVAEGSFQAFITLDKNLPKQQNLAARKISIIIVRAKSNRLADIRLHLGALLAELSDLRPSQVIEVGFRS